MTQTDPPPQQTADHVLTIKECKEIAGELGEPSKMPGLSYGLSAKLCNVGGRLREVKGSVCSGCFAMKGWYARWRPLLEGHARRERGIRHPLWVEAMVRLITNYCVGDEKDRYFRWHDSGDLRGMWHLENIVAVCRRTPTVRYWLPTREYELVESYLSSGKTFPDNLCVRLSAHMIDCEPVLPAALADLPRSTVSSIPLTHEDTLIVEGKGSVECRAIELRGNECGDCRACWDRRVVSVNYPQH